MTKHEMRHSGKGMRPYDRAGEPPRPPRAVWCTYPRCGDAPVLYYGRVLDASEREVVRCAHKHVSRDEAADCAHKMLRVVKP